jgi:hypothetical protein
MISTLLFDMNDVLYSYDRSVRVAHIARICREPATAVAEAIWESGFEDSGDSGVMDADAYLAGFGERLGFPLTQDEPCTRSSRSCVRFSAATFLFQPKFTHGSPNRKPIFVAWRALALRRTPRYSSTIASRTCLARSALGCAHIYIGAPRAWRGC